MVAGEDTATPSAERPRHVAITMDGNGRWAQGRGLPRVEGHRAGVASVRAITEHAARLGLEQLTLYCFSTENWRRPQPEVDALMHLLEQYLIEERSTLTKQNVKLSVIGQREGLPARVLDEMDRTLELSAGHTGLRLCLAINYGSRQELVDAACRLARRVVSGELSIDDIDEATLASALYTAGMSDPDLLIRTAGEMRISNFLLWQISYSEIWVTPKCWPDFREADFDQAIGDYAQRRRTYGGLHDA
ncbi:MAG: isoprenyl transferase [Pirellulales bacterium]|nr:isoprenyl transferase [Pirellulales bacterium]